MTDNSREDRRREFDGRIDTLGTGNNGLNRRNAGRIGSARDEQEDEEENAEEAAESPLADEEAPESDESEDQDAEAVDEADAEVDDETDEGTVDEADETDETPRTEGVTPKADVSFDDEDDDEQDTDVGSGSLRETRIENVDDRASLEIELDPFVRAHAARRADESDESLDEYVVGSVKGYLAGLLGGEVSSPGTLEREVDVEADPIFGGLLESIADEHQTPAEVVVDAVARTHDVPIDEETLVVAGLRDHEALLNGVVANDSNDLGNVSEVVQAAVETRLVEEPA